MRRIRFQNKVAASSSTLPAAALFSILFWLFNGIGDVSSIGGLAACGFIAFLLVWLNGLYALIRYRSRLIASIFVLWIGACSFLHGFQTGTFVAMAMAVAFHTLFRSYQERFPMTQTLQTFCCLGIASMAFPHILYLVPVLYWIMWTKLRSLQPRSFFASLLGLILPYWFWFGYLLIWGDVGELTAHFLPLTEFQPILWDRGPVIDISSIDLKRRVAFCAWAWIALVSTVRYARTSYDDKTQVRMFYHIFILHEFFFLLLLLLLPLQFDTLFYLLLLSSSPLIAHFFAHTNRWVTNAVFILFLIQFITLAVYTTWNHLFNF